VEGRLKTWFAEGFSAHLKYNIFQIIWDRCTIYCPFIAITRNKYLEVKRIDSSQVADKS